MTEHRDFFGKPDTSIESKTEPVRKMVCLNCRFKFSISEFSEHAECPKCDSTDTEDR